MRRRLRVLRTAPDDGNAIVEFVFVALVVLVPLIYLVGTLAALQRDQLAVTQAARDAGRAFATSDTADEASARVEAAVRLALADQGLRDVHSEVRFVASGASCDAHGVTPRLAPGAEFTVCVSVRGRLPLVPTILSGRGIRETGAYVVHVDDFRTVGR